MIEMKFDDMLEVESTSIAIMIPSQILWKIISIPPP